MSGQGVGERLRSTPGSNEAPSKKFSALMRLGDFIPLLISGTRLVVPTSLNLQLQAHLL